MHWNYLQQAKLVAEHKWRQAYQILTLVLNCAHFELVYKHAVEYLGILKKINAKIVLQQILYPIRPIE